MTDDRSDELRDWYAADELPGDGLTPIPGLPSDHYGEERLIDPPSAPLPVAGTIYADFKTGQAPWTLRAWRGGWMIWRTTHWIELDDARLFGRAVQSVVDATDDPAEQLVEQP